MYVGTPGYERLRPHWSVVIPCWRPRRAWLSEAVQSAINVGCRQENVILVWDGADPKVQNDLIGSFPRITCIVREVAEGVAIARATGLSHVRTELVSFLDQDDRLTGGMATALQACDALKGTKAVVGGMEVLDVGSGSVRRRVNWPQTCGLWKDAVLDLMLENAQIGRWIVPTEVAQRCEFAREAGFADDRAYVAQVASQLPVVYVGVSVITYRQHEKQRSRGTPQRRSENNYVSNVLVECARARFNERTVVRRRRAASLYWDAWHKLQGRQSGKALVAVVATMIADPSIIRHRVARRSVGVMLGGALKGIISRWIGGGRGGDGGRK